MKQRTGGIEPETRVVATDTLCADLSGRMGFSPESTEQFLQMLAALPASTSPKIIVQSPGGMVELGMEMGEAIVARHAAVYVHGTCASSCANYMFLGAAERHIMKDGVVMFHGGVTRSSMQQERPEGMPEGYLEANFARQTAFLTSAGVNPEFFEWFDGLNQVNSNPACPMSDYDWLVFSPEALHSIGAPVVENQGPTSQEELDRVTDPARRASEGMDPKICYWQPSIVQDPVRQVHQSR